MWCAASGGSNWGGAVVYVSNDGNSYANIGTITGSCRTGVLASALPTYSLAPTGRTVDNVNTLAVNLTQSAGQLLAGSQQDALNLATACYVDGEIIAYQNATLTGASQYSLSYLVRGAYGSPISAHNAGTKFARLDGGLLKIPFTQDRIGQTIYIKFCSFNIYGGGLQSLASVQPAAYTFKGTALASPPPDVANLRSNFVANNAQMVWDEVTDFRPIKYEIRKGASWLSSQTLGRYAHPPFNLMGNDTYWVNSVTQPAAGLTVYGLNPQQIVITGASITKNVIASYDEAATGWSGTFGGTARSFGATVRTTDAGNVLTIANVLTEPDILDYGGQANGTYTIPVGHRINIGRVAACNVLISWQAYGLHPSFNVLAQSNVLTLTDMLDFAASLNIDVYPQIRLSQDGTTWGAWQPYVAGVYSAMAYDAQIVLATYDPTVQAVLSGFTFAVDVPDRNDHYVSKAIAAGGTTINFTPDGSSTPTPFNGGTAGSPSAPAIQVTINGATAGDDVILSAVTLSSCTVQVVNGGVGVARNVTILAQGY